MGPGFFQTSGYSVLGLQMVPEFSLTSGYSVLGLQMGPGFYQTSGYSVKLQIFSRKAMNGCSQPLQDRDSGYLVLRIGSGETLVDS